MPATPVVPPAPTPPRLRVGIVGAGRVGSVLGAALARAGHQPVAVAAVSAASRRRAERLLPGVPVCPADEVARAAELLLLAVPDDTLPGLADGLASAGAVRSGSFVVHTSGAYGLGVLDPLTACGARPLALHPVMTFAGGEEDLSRLAGACFGVTAPAELRPVGETLVVQMGGEPVWVADPARPLYHAGLALAANSTVSLIAAVAELLERAGVEDPRRVLSPLMYAAVDNGLRRGDRALTGPVARGDAGVVAAHLRVLGSVDPEAAAAYRALARLTAGRALGCGLLPSAKAEALLDVLAATDTPASNGGTP